jgi:Ca2+-binding RTX toxin-like protein
LGRDGDDLFAGDSFAPNGNAVGGGDDRLQGGPGDDAMTGDSRGASASGGGDDVLEGGPGSNDLMVGDSQAAGNASGNDGDDVLNTGADGVVFFAIGDHTTHAPGLSAIGAGDDKITGGSADEFLVGDSSADAVTDAGADVISGRRGNDTLFGDNANFDLTATIGGVGGDDQLNGNAGNDTLRAGPANDKLDGGANVDDCDGEAGTGDEAKRCEVLAGVP